MDEKVISYVLVNPDKGQIFYWKYGQAGGWTLDLQEARRYTRESSAHAALLRLRKRPTMSMTICKVEAIEESI